MTNAGEQHSSHFESLLLRNLSASVQARQNPLRHQTKTLSVTRELEPEVSGLSERMNIDVELAESRPTQARLSVWPDGTLWFRACTPDKRGWAFLLSFSANLIDSSDEDVVSYFEQSLGIVHGASRDESTCEQLLHLWRAFEPEVEDAT